MGLSFPTLQRGNAVLDALRRKRTRSFQTCMSTQSVARLWIVRSAHLPAAAQCLVQRDARLQACQP
ncbi:hypothetical protein CX658_26750 [Pseudomonas amygdali pv. lachrymans]|nr:hypothetical protein CX658_26750 [Pseudomonas amygdali pv. lachrymans]